MQGSVLDPLLWNITYNRVLTVRDLADCRVLGYADDTLIVGTGKTVEETRSQTNRAVVSVLRRFDLLGLTVAVEKTDAVLFRGRSRPRIEPVVRMSPHFKYLGLLIDSRLTFRAHFEYVREKVTKVTRAFSGLMPNLRGPHDGRRRRLYANVLASIALYGASIWCDALFASPPARRVFRGLQRSIAIRVCSAYRTIAFDAVTLLARVPSLELFGSRT